MEGWLGAIVVGLIAGWLAGTIMRGSGFGCIGNVVVGLVGGVVGKWVFEQLKVELAGGFINALMTALVGAIVLLALANIIFPPRRR